MLEKILDFIRSTEISSLTINGKGDKTTVKAIQQFFKSLGTYKLGIDGVITGQKENHRKFRPALTSVKNGKGGSATVKAMQKWCGIKETGLWDEATSKGLQEKLKSLNYFDKDEEIDGIAGPKTFKAFQECINNKGQKKESKKEESKPTQIQTQTIGDNVLKACKEQADWMKKAKYGKYKPVTLEHSKEYGTCVTYVGCVLQRLGYKKSGGYVWHDGKGYGTGKVTGTTKRMTVTYMNNKELKSLKSKIQKGDIILLDDNKSGVSGSGGHIMISTGKWKGDNPYVWDQEPNCTCIKSGKSRTYNGSRKVLAIVRLK